MIKSVLERYKESYYDYGIGYSCAGNAYVWVAEEIFGMFTYDNDISELFVKEMFEVFDVILNGTNFEYIKDEDNYVKYLRVCMMLDQLKWINWGSSIRGAWFDEDVESRDILDGTVPFTANNLTILMNFVKKEIESEEH